MDAESSFRLLEDLCVDEKGAIAMGPFGSRIKAENYTKGGVPMIRGNNLARPPFYDDDFVFVSDDFASGLTSHMAVPGDLLLAHRGSLGQIGMIPLDARFPRYITGNSLVRVRLDPAKADARFVYYYLTSPAGQQEWLANKVQTGVPAIATPTATTRKLLVPTPPVETQRAIGKFLGALDDRIALNHAMNQTLEDIARAIFKSWFIDFDPVHAKANGEPTGLPPEIDALFPSGFVETAYGLIPEGWKFQQLGDDLSVLETGRRPTGGVAGFSEGVPSIGAESITRIGEFDFAKTKYVPEEYFLAMNTGHLASHDVLLYKDGGRPGEFKPHVSMFANGWPYARMAINEHVFRMRGTDCSQEYLYCWLSSEPIMREMEDVGTGAAIPGITRTAVQRLPLVRPPQELLDAWTRLVSPLFEKLFANCAQSRTLSELRDALLPRLVSGELQIPVEVAG